MIGLWYASFGLGDIIIINGKYPFNYEGDNTCQNIYQVCNCSYHTHSTGTCDTS